MHNSNTAQAIPIMEKNIEWKARNKLLKQENSVLTSLVNQISLHPSDVQIVDVKQPTGRVTGSKIVFMQYGMDMAVKMGAAGGEVWKEIRVYQTIEQDPRYSFIKEYMPRFLGYTCSSGIDAFALENLKEKGYVELYDLFQTPSVTSHFKHVQSQVIIALSTIHHRTLSQRVPDIEETYIKNRLSDSMTKVRMRLGTERNQSDLKDLLVFLNSDEVRINGERLTGLRPILRMLKRGIKILKPPVSGYRHGDFHLKNILVKGNSVKFIDWVNSGDNQDILYDIGKYMHYPLEFYSLQLVQDKKTGISVEDFQLKWNKVSKPPEISYDIKAFIPRGTRELIKEIPKYHFLFSDDHGDKYAPGRLILAISSAEIGGVKYLSPKLSLICLAESLRMLNLLIEKIGSNQTDDLDGCIEALIEQ